MISYRWLLTYPSGEVLEMGSLPPFTIEEVRERYPTAAVERLSESHIIALAERKRKVSRYDGRI